MKVDSHVHTRNSPDGKDAIEDIVAQAKEKNLVYLCTTDHLDYDLKFGDNRAPIPWNHIDLEKYASEWQAAKKKLDSVQSEPESVEEGKLKFCFGVEAGFDENKEVQKKYAETLSSYDFDEVINSVHFVNGMDVYFPVAFFFKSREKMYGDYLDKIAASLDAPYDYDIVAHVGYVTRNAPYKNKELRYADFPEKFDRILNGIIQRNKALEVNTHHAMNPTREILERYYELGGRKISFGSDSHRGEITKDFEVTCGLLREIGFDNFSVYVKHREILVPIESWL